MVATSLAAQLSKGVSLNASLLADRSRRKHAESYLFASREADQHDYHSIHALGVNGLSKLKSLNAKFAKYDANLFSDAARDLDRTLQSESQNAELDRTLGSFLRDLGPYLLESPSSKALEWIIRRFRVNEFNVDGLMALFLPYHETAQFAKMISILHVKESNLWSFLVPLKAAAKPLPRSMLVDEMLVNQDLARFVLALFPDALGAGQTYRTLTGFTASVTINYLSRKKKVDQEIVAFVLPALTRAFAPDSNQDAALAGYVSLAALSQRCHLSPQGLVAVLSEMIKGQRHVNSRQILPFFVALVAPQDQQEEFPESIVDNIVNLPGFIDTLADCWLYVGVEKLVLPLLPSLVKRVNETIAGNILNSLLTSPSVVNSAIERTINLLLGTMLRSKGEPNSVALQLLTVIYQRHGPIFSEESAKLLAAIVEEGDRQTFEQILRSVALPSTSSGDHGKWILSSNAADIASRVTAVREIIKTLASTSVESENNVEMCDALRARVADSNVAVIESLYSDPKAVLPIFSNLSFIEAASCALAAPDVSRAVMRLHFAFIAGEVYRHSPDLAPNIFERIFLPYLLFTKPRQKTAAYVWQLLSDSMFAQYELLQGCTDVLVAHPIADATTRSIEEMTMVNLSVASCIAGNIVASNAYPRHLNMLLCLLSSSDAHTTNICYLILRSLLNQLSGEHQVDAAQRILSSMGIQSLDVFQGVMAGATTLQEVISNDMLLKGVILKPSSPGITRRLQVAILALLPIVQQPVDVKIDWLGDGPLNSSDMRGKNFKELAHSIYALANSSSTAGSLSTSLLKALFVNLREQTLLFLAGVWTCGILSDTELVDLSHAALFHGAAFLRAQVGDEEHPHDFQVVLPPLFIALRSAHPAVRSAAMDCVSIISQSATATGSPAVYALDSVYGTRSSDVQYLEWLDFGHLVSTLNSRREHFLNDGEFLGVFAQELLCKSPSDNKKESGYKQRILCYLLSHAIAWNSISARVGLLEILKNIPHRVKLHMLLPLIQTIVSGDQVCLWDMEDKPLGAAYLQLLLGAYDRTAAPELTEPGSGSWTTFIKLVRFAFMSDKAPTSAHKAVLHQLCSSLFGSLTTDLKREICILLVECADASPDYNAAIKDAMGILLKEGTLIASLLVHFQPAGTDSSHRASKRPKLTPDDATKESALGPMTVLVEILVAHDMPGSVELMSTGLDVLTRVFHTHSSQSDANYLMQLLMSMLKSIASSILDHKALAPNSVRMEILVELLRVSDNPQTFNQALLLIANLARLAPEFVMQNVMPVFTFMGSNVFHRDDTYSFRVVQKTIDSIVPVVITSLKAKNPGSLELQIASRDFLRVFTDAATHVPRHRRTKFFSHLVDVLGRDEFAVSICLLLVDKVANRVVRKKPGETANALGLPLAILQANSMAVPFTSIEELLRETTRLLGRFANSDSMSQDAFLEPSQDGDQSTPSVTATKRQMEAIVLFVDLVLQKSSRNSNAPLEATSQESVGLLLGLANLDKENSPEFSDVSKAATKALGHLLRVISATEFAATISTILSSNNLAIETGAMNLLASRLANITPKIRQDISPTITGIIDHMCKTLKNSPDASSFLAILNALRAIAETADTREIPTLTRALPLIINNAVNQRSCTANALECILPLCMKIGPRVLPFFHDLVGFCSNVLRDSQSDPDGDGFRFEQPSQAVLVALLSSISQFWSIDELVRLGELSLQTRPIFLSLRKTMAKRVPAKQLLPALLRIWAELSASQSPSWSAGEAFFDLFKRVVRNAPRDDVHDNLRDIFKLFLDAFDMCGQLDRQGTEKFEALTLAAFVDVVTKLNDAAFRPIFRRLFDWAFIDVSEKLIDRQIMFCRVLRALVTLLKGLVTPYMGMTLAPLTNILESFTSNRSQPETLWMSVVELFHTCLTEDEGAFWRADKLRRLIPPFVTQVGVCPSLGAGAGDTRLALKNCLGAVVALMDDDDAALKTLNLELLMQTRADASQVRLFALECAAHLWDAHGDRLAGLASDTVPFVAECADDEHDDVGRAARALKRVMERTCGSLDVLMQ
ncbi:armadillo-type protein [Gautieria morchelliformis]|nr:armadillo-type protein [Gautieria morchelliformis]